MSPTPPLGGWGHQLVLNSLMIFKQVGFCDLSFNDSCFFAFMHTSVVIEFYAIISIFPKFTIDIPNDKTTTGSSTPPVPAGTPIPSEYVLLIYWLNILQSKIFSDFRHLFCVDLWVVISYLMFSC